MTGPTEVSKRNHGSWPPEVKSFLRNAVLVVTLLGGVIGGTWTLSSHMNQYQTRTEAREAQRKNNEAHREMQSVLDGYKDTQSTLEERSKLQNLRLEFIQEKVDDLDSGDEDWTTDRLRKRIEAQEKRLKRIENK